MPLLLILFYFFSPPPLHFISFSPSLSPLSGKALPAGEGWEGRESLSRQQIESAEEERKEFRGGLRRWDVRRRHSAGGTLPKVSSRVAHPGADSPSCSALHLHMGNVVLELVQSLRTLSLSRPGCSGTGFAPLQGVGSPKRPPKLWGDGVWWKAAEFCGIPWEKPFHQLSPGPGPGRLRGAKGMLRL